MGVTDTRRRRARVDGSRAGPAVSRRAVLKAALGAAAALAVPGALSATAGNSRKRIALIATEVRKYAHAQHFIDRFLEGYGWHGAHHRPEMDLVALFVDQFPE